MIKKLSLFLILTTLVSCSHVSNIGRVPAQVKEANVSENIKNEFPEKVQQFLEWEFHANTANDPSARKEQFFRVQHYEIPTDLIDQDIAESLDPKIRESLIFMKDGVEHIRWVINPEDTYFHIKIKDFLESKGLDASPKSLFAGGLTASRSMILADKDTGAVFSLKVSTDNTGGTWQDKGVNSKQVKKARITEKIKAGVENKFNFQELKVQSEKMGGFIRGINQGFIVRELGEEFSSGEKYYLPGFSAMNDEVGRQIAKLNGSDDPAKFWSKHYHEQLGKATGEMLAFFGLSFSSAHSQQYVIELDENFKPTGKIVFRDIADSLAFKDFFSQHKDINVEENWPKDRIRSKPAVSSGTLHGMTPPSWIKAKEYKEMNELFFSALDEKLSLVTNIPKVFFEAGELKGKSNQFSYYHKEFFYDSAVWEEYVRLARCYQGHKKTRLGNDCAERLKHLPEKYKKFVVEESDEKLNKKTPRKIKLPRFSDCLKSLKNILTPLN